MTLNEILKILDVEPTNNDLKINNIEIDSRKINKNDLFIAIKGINYDGNDYIEDAMKNGAIACIVSSEINIPNCIKIKDTKEALYKIANYIRNKYNVPLIAITGSNGKTTTKELIYHILSSKYDVLKNIESKNNLIGVSTTLFKLNQKIEIIVMELGTNHMGEIGELSRMCNPSVGLITNIGTSHIGYFKSRKNIYKEKMSIVDGMNNKKLIVNGDDEYLSKLDYYKCGLNVNNDLKAYNIIEDRDKVIFNIFLDKEYKMEFNNPGRHFVNDILLAIKISLDYNIKINTIIKRIKTFRLSSKRMNLIKLDNNNILINDCYNASFESIMAGINYLSILPNKKLLILGDILELGKHSKSIHKRINREIMDKLKCDIVTVGKYSKYIRGLHFKNSEGLVKYLEKHSIKNTYIYIKGSRRVNLDLVSNYFISNINKKST